MKYVILTFKRRKIRYEFHLEKQRKRATVEKAFTKDQFWTTSQNYYSHHSGILNILVATRGQRTSLNITKLRFEGSLLTNCTQVSLPLYFCE